MYNDIDPIKNFVLIDFPLNVIVKQMKLFLKTPFNRNDYIKNLIVVASVLND